MIKNVGSLSQSPPSARAHSLFPHLPALHERASLLRKQAEAIAIIPPPDHHKEEHDPALVQKQAGYLTSFLEYLDAEWEPVYVYFSWPTWLTSVIVIFVVICWNRNQTLQRLLEEKSIIHSLLWVVFKPGMKVKLWDSFSGEMVSFLAWNVIISRNSALIFQVAACLESFSPGEESDYQQGL